MRRDHRPHWLKRWQKRRSESYARHRLHPQFDALGEGATFINPRLIDVIGPNIRAGRKVHINADIGARVKLCVWYSGFRLGRIDIGDYALISPGTQIISSIGISIGADTMIASNCYISDSDWHDVYDRTAESEHSAPITIGENVWIGYGCIIAKGVTIGDNSVIGAGSVVVKDIPANVIAAGSPAIARRELDMSRPIKRRRDLLETPGLDAQMDALDAMFLKDNSLLGYWRAKLFPGNKD